MLSGGDKSLTCKFLWGTELPVKDVWTVLEHRFVNTPTDDLLRQTHVAASDSHSQAVRWLLDRKVCDWIKDRNDQAGQAPSYCQVQNRRLIVQCELTLQDTPRQTPMTRHVRQWVRRFGKRVQCRRAFMTVHTGANAAESAVKACSPGPFFFEHVTTKVGPQNRPAWRASK